MTEKMDRHIEGILNVSLGEEELARLLNDPSNILLFLEWITSLPETGAKKVLRLQRAALTVQSFAAQTKFSIQDILRGSVQLGNKIKKASVGTRVAEAIVERAVNAYVDRNYDDVSRELLEEARSHDATKKPNRQIAAIRGNIDTPREQLLDLLYSAMDRKNFYREIGLKLRELPKN